MNRVLLPLLILLVGFVAFNLFAYQLENPEEVARVSQVAMLGEINDMSHIRICVLDEGTAGYNIVKDRLSSNIKLLGDETTNGNFHGLGMAQELLAASGATQLPEDKQPQILIVPAEGFTQLKSGVETCIQEKVDIILHSINWEWSSNFDGDGFINQLVREATKKGILWVNSAGNNGGLTYHSNVKLANDDESLVSLPDDENTLRFSNQLDSNTVSITMSWNDFEDINYATKKDMDFILYSIVEDPEDNQKMKFVEMELEYTEEGKSGKIRQKFGQKKQIGRHRTANDSQEVTGNALETAEMQLDKGEYAIRVIYKSKKSEIKETDQFRIILRSQKPESLKMKSAQHHTEITPPADNPRVIAVGLKDAPFSAMGPTPNGSVKPDLVLDLGPQSLSLRYSDGTTKGPDTSDAAAIFAGVAVALKARDKSIGINEVHSYLDYLSRMQNLNPQSGRGPVWQTPTHTGMLKENSEQPTDNKFNNPQRNERRNRNDLRPYDRYQPNNNSSQTPNLNNGAYPQNTNGAYPNNSNGSYPNNNGTRYYPQTPRQTQQGSPQAPIRH
jgi:hypothetical protein